MTSSKIADGSPLRLALDTSVWLSLGNRHSPISQFIFASRASLLPYQIYISPQLLVELQTGLTDRLNLPQPFAVGFIKSLLKVAKVSYPLVRHRHKDLTDQECRLLELSFEIEADLIVAPKSTAEKIKSHAGALIMQPAQLNALFCF